MLGFSREDAGKDPAVGDGMFDAPAAWGKDSEAGERVTHGAQSDCYLVLLQARSEQAFIHTHHNG